ncbi:neuraminidase-like domain-containing protein, partial [Morganella morganii]|uniref:neuraminidase-like domain-containing protein n=1 Tax=Morganella morganii TaxID=582 RepID=UPI0021D0313E
AQMALYAGISPELYAILTENIGGSDKTTEELLENNFPGVNPESLMNLDALANYYELPRDEIQALPEAALSMPKTALPEWPESGSGKWIAKLQRDNPGQLHYIDLVPQNGNQFLVNFNMKATHSNLSTLRILTGNNSFSTLYEKENFIPQSGQHYSIPVTLDSSKLTKGAEIAIQRASPINGGNYYTSAFFTDSAQQLLALNKTLRLAKAAGMTPTETQRALTRLRFSDNDTDAIVLHRFTEALLYRKRYSIDTETALMLCNADISRVSYDGQLSQFDRLFNNPPLNGVTYTLNGSEIPMTPDAEDPRREVLKRAFRVDNTGLWQIFDITARDDSDKKDKNNIENLSDLLLVRLLADVHNLTVAQLDTLLRISPYSTTNIYQIKEEKRRELITFLYQTTQWLNTQNITVEQLYLLLTREAPAVPTKEMATLLDALRNGGIDSTNTDTLRTTMAPVIAAAMQIDSPEQGEALLHWLDKNHPDNMLTTDKIWPLITAENPSADQQKQLAAWCQALAQRVLVIRTFALSNAELQILSQGAPAGTIAALREISDFHDLINRCGEQAGAVLDALQSNTLSTALLAGALNLSEYVITQALTQAGQSTSLTSWKQLAALPSRLDLADNLLITPKDITNLLTVSDNAAPSYTELTTLAGLLQAGLNEQQTTQLQNQSEPRRSEALSGEYRALVMGKPLANRDDIWRKLLIDGKVSAEITTTRLADAIAGIQLYINRTVAGDEPGAGSAVLERQFFKDWDIYNKRYSTWAGVSQLVYYPENFIDPTIRTGQTGMMNTMLEQLSQSELNSDTLEDGFRQYLTAFEQVANLKVISGYHDAVDIDEGNTWFIGTSQTEPKKYYWRKADHSKCQNGRFAANAWSDWKEITCAVNPYQDMVRPVIFRSRLYLLWVEEQVRKDDEGKKDISSFTLKLTHIKYDGSWASPFSYDVSGKLESTSRDPALYCSTNPDDNTLTIACYQKDVADSTAAPNVYFGLFIRQNMTSTDASGLTGTLTLVKKQLDTVSVVKVNTLMYGRYRAEFSQLSQDGNTSLDLTLSPGNYSVDKNDILTLTPDAYITIDSEKFFSEIGENIRYYFISELNSYSGTLYTPESIKYQRLRDPFPDGNVTLAILRTNSYEDNLMGLTITGKSNWNKPEQFIVSDKKQNYHFLMNPIEQNETNHSAGYISENYVENSQFISDAAQYTFNDTLSSDYGAELNIGKLIKLAEPLSTDNIRIDFIASDGNTFKTIKGSDTKMTAPIYPEYREETLRFAFGALSLKLPGEGNKKTITVKVSYTGTEPLVASTRYQLILEVPKISERVISLYTTEDGAQYMEWDAYRTRLNTLFARQL